MRGWDGGDFRRGLQDTQSFIFHIIFAERPFSNSISSHLSCPLGLLTLHKYVVPFRWSSFGLILYLSISRFRFFAFPFFLFLFLFTLSSFPEHFFGLGNRDGEMRMGMRMRLRERSFLV